MSVNYLCNLITLFPDGNPITLTDLSPTGWYVVYRPDTSNQAYSSRPLPVYHVKTFNDYYGWTTMAPIGCHGQASYVTGYCDVAIQRVEESYSILRGISGDAAPVDKDSIDVTGRYVYPKLSYPGNYETYCFYQFQGHSIHSVNIKRVIIDDRLMIDNKWTLGFINYRSVPNPNLVGDKTFGSPITANLRAIGDYKDILRSLQNYQVDPISPNQLPSVRDVQLLPVSQFSFTPANQTLTISNSPSQALVTLTATSRSSGNPSGSNISHIEQVDNSYRINLGSDSTTSINLSTISFSSYPTDIKVEMGNRVYSFTI